MSIVVVISVAADEYLTSASAVVMLPVETLSNGAKALDVASALATESQSLSRSRIRADGSEAGQDGHVRNASRFHVRVLKGSNDASGNA